MDKDLIEVYARGNMLEKLLAVLLADILKRENDPKSALQAFRNDLVNGLLAAQIPSTCSYEEGQILRQRGLVAADQFARNIAASLDHSIATEFRE